jgi:hypothetical protein
MSDRGSPSDHADTGTEKPHDDAPASAASPPDGSAGSGTDAKTSPDASSPSDQGAKEHAAQPTLAEVIKTAAEKPDVEGKSPTPAKDGKDKDVPADPAAPDKDASKTGEPDDTKLSFHNHPRFQEIASQNRQYKDQVRALEPDADQYRKIQGFMDEHRLTPDEVGEGFIIMAMAKNGDPRVIQKLDEFRNRVALTIGEAIPQDIQDKIDIGELSESAGKELAKSRATLKLTEAREAERTEQQKRDQATRDRETLANAQASAVSAWEVEARKSDPDFADKDKAIAKYAKALMQDYGIPRTPADAVQLIKMAYAEVNKDFAVRLPKKSAVARVPIAPSSNGAKPAPKSLREVIEQAASMGS